MGIAAVLVSLLAVVGQGDPAPSPVDDHGGTEEAVLELVAQLSSPQYHQREEAHRALEDMGAGIVPILMRYQNTGALESRRRISLLIHSYDWMGTGALVLEITPGSWAEKTDLSAGDVVLRVDDVDITNHSSLSATDSSVPRRLYIRKPDGSILEDIVPPGTIGTTSTSWVLQQGGIEQVHGVIQWSLQEHDRAADHFQDAYREGMRDPSCLYFLSAILEQRLEHPQALKYFLEGRKGLGLGDDDCTDVHKYDAAKYHSLPLHRSYSAWLMARYARQVDNPSEELVHQLLDWTTNGVTTNLPLTRTLLKTAPLNSSSSHREYWLRSARMLLAYHDRKWDEVIEHYPHCKDWGTTSRLATGATIETQRPLAISFAAKELLKTQKKGRCGYDGASWANCALAALLAAGREDLAKDLVKSYDALSENDRARVLNYHAHLAMANMYCNAFISDMLGRYARQSNRNPYLWFTYCNVLMNKKDLTLEEWNRAWKKRLDITESLDHWYKFDGYSYHAYVLLRLGHYDQAIKEARLASGQNGVDRLVTAAQWCKANAKKIQQDWSVLQGTIEVKPTGKDGQAWTIRYDGRTFLVDEATGPKEIPGLNPGEVHLPVLEDQLVIQPTGTMMIRAAEVYLLDEENMRWVPCYVQFHKEWSCANAYDTPAGPIVLRYILEHYPINGTGREMMRRPVGVGGWHFYEFRGDFVIAVHPETHQVIDLAEVITEMGGYPQRVRMSRMWFRNKDVWALFPTDRGLWSMNADGKIQRVNLPMKNQDVPVQTIGADPENTLVYVGVAPHCGGQIFALDIKTRTVTRTNGFCSRGPDESFNWWHRPKFLRYRPCGLYAIQHIYRKRLEREAIRNADQDHLEMDF